MASKVLLVLGCVLLTTAHARLIVKPTSFVPNLTPDLNFRCELGQMALAVSNVLFMQLEREDAGNVVALVSLQAGSTVKIAPSTIKDRIVAQGMLDNNHLQAAYVEMTLQHPVSTDQGLYKCAVTVMDLTGVVTTATFTAQVTVDLSLNATATVSYIQHIQQQVVDLIIQQKQTKDSLMDLTVRHSNITNRLSTCESQVSMMNSRLANAEDAQSKMNNTLIALENDKHICCDVAGSLRNKSHNEYLDLQSKLTTMSNQCPIQCKTRLNDVEANMTRLSHAGPSVAFSVGYTSTTAAGQTNVPLKGEIKFEEVLVNKGNSYDRHTGVFTTPINGTYILLLNFPLQDTDPQRVVNVALILNHQFTIGQIQSGQGSNMHPSSLNLLYNLIAGDIVTVELYVLTNAGSTSPLNVGRNSAFFAGFLLH